MTNMEKNIQKNDCIEPKTFEATKQMLKTIFKISSTFNGLMQQDEILRQFSIYLMGQFAIKNFALYLFDKTKASFVLLESKNFDNIAEIIDNKYLDFQGNNIINLENSDHKNNNLFDKDIAKFAIMLSENKGLLVIGSRMLNKDFTEMDFSFMISISELAILAFENSRLISEEKKKILLEQELNTAREIQQVLLPKNNPVIDNYEIIGDTQSSLSVGGDYYDFIKIDDENYMIVVADVCGNGIPAALIMSNLQSALKSQLFFVTDLRKIISNLNSIIYDNTDADRYVTFFYGILNIKTNKFTYINAGHNPPIFYQKHNKKINLLDVGGTIIGAFDPLPFGYELGQIELKSGDLILFYTDGIIEAKDKNGKLLDEEWLVNFVENNSEISAKQMFEKIKNETNNCQPEENDDITLIVLKKM